MEEPVVVNDSKSPPNTKQFNNEVLDRSSDNDEEQNSPSIDTELNNSSTTADKGSKKRTLKRNVCTTVNSETPSKQVKQTNTQVVEEQPSVTVSQQSQPSLAELSSNGPSEESPLDRDNKSPTSIRAPVAEPVTPSKPSKNVETCSLSELESPVVSLIFSPSGDNATTSQDESCSCVEESENESASLTQQSQDASSVQHSQSESAVTDDLDSDCAQKIDVELEDSDDCTERMNAKLCVERDVSSGNYSKNYLFVM